MGPNEQERVLPASYQQTMPQPVPEPLRELQAVTASPSSSFLPMAGVGLLFAGAMAAGLVSYPWHGGADRGGNLPPTQAAVETAGGGDFSPSRLFQVIAANEIDKAIAGLIMADTDRTRVRQAVMQKQINLAAISVSDSDVEDGDWVRITAGGFSQDVRLFKKPIQVVVPYVPGAPILLSGLVDGDGRSITVAVHSSGGQYALKPLQKGESIQVPSP